MLPNDYIKEWEKRPEEIRKLTEKGIVPMEHDIEEGKDTDYPFIMGQVAAIVKDIKPAGKIVQDMVSEAVDMLRVGNSFILNGSATKL